jgi:hypothetical protein
MPVLVLSAVLSVTVRSFFSALLAQAAAITCGCGESAAKSAWSASSCASWAMLGVWERGSLKQVVADVENLRRTSRSKDPLAAVGIAQPARRRG